jgi:hypothetical protein
MPQRVCLGDHQYIEYEVDESEVLGIRKKHHRLRCVECGVKVVVTEPVR